MLTRPGLVLLTLALAACNGNEATSSDGAVAPGTGGTPATGGNGGSPGTGGGAGGSAAGGGGAGDAGAGGTGAGGASAVDAGGGACNVVLATPPSEGGAHLVLCSATTYGTNPPSSGGHYAVWPVFRVYDKPVPWGYLVHGLEHGVVVIAYNCPDGCAQEVADAKAMIATLPAKPGCTGPAVIMTPDPTLTTRWAASAWQNTLRATCFDKDAFATFANAHMNLGPERIAGDCGAVDREAAGWCN